MVEWTEKTLTREGCTLHYWVSPAEERGPWLLFLHGAGADHHMFDRQYPAVTGRYGLIALDLRGAGLSRPMGEAPTPQRLLDDALTLLDREGIGRVTVLGHSMGGNLAQELVRQRPDRVERLALIDCTCNSMRLTAMERFALRCTPAIFAMYPAKALIRQSAAASALTVEARDYLAGALGKVGKRDFATIMSQATGFLVHDEGYRIPRPFLLVCGRADGTGNIRKCAPVWASREPLCEFHWIEDAGHCAHMDRPQEFCRLMLEFLERPLPDHSSDEKGTR
jgi:Predicted hydrolases or acyltransferases (alpha/beta hydrolase superfamily)